MSNRKNKYFGTDGFRAKAGEGLCAHHAYKIGRFLGWYYSSALSGCMEAVYRPRVAIGKDTRLSCDMLECALAAGLCASGADAYLLGVLPTPAVAHVTRADGFDCGVMVSASHNPFYDNGIKIINGGGEKLCDGVIALIEAYIDGDTSGLGVRGELPSATCERVGRTIAYPCGREKYLSFLASFAPSLPCGFTLGLDCGNGAAAETARALFSAIGVRAEVMGAEPSGLNINEGCGSLHTGALCALVREKQLCAGFAFDGDGDRCIAVDENGNVLDGDAMLYVLAKGESSRGELQGGAVAATVMSGTGLRTSLKKEGIGLEETAVGDRFVYERMKEKGLSLGGEQSGHIIFRKHATTGDGILTALMLLCEVARAGAPLSALASGLERFPQYSVNVRVKDKFAAIHDAAVRSAVERAEREIGASGRVLLRASGTEPLVRVMAECESKEKCKLCAEEIARVIEKSEIGL